MSHGAVTITPGVPSWGIPASFVGTVPRESMAAVTLGTNAVGDASHAYSLRGVSGAFELHALYSDPQGEAVQLCPDTTTAAGVPFLEVTAYAE